MKERYFTTLGILKEEGACPSGYAKLCKALGGARKYGKHKPIYFTQVLKSNGINDCIWAMFHSSEESRELVLRWTILSLKAISHEAYSYFYPEDSDFTIEILNKFNNLEEISLNERTKIFQMQNDDRCSRIVQQLFSAILITSDVIAEFNGGFKLYSSWYKVAHAIELSSRVFALLMCAKLHKHLKYGCQILNKRISAYEVDFIEKIKRDLCDILIEKEKLE